MSSKGFVFKVLILAGFTFVAKAETSVLFGVDVTAGVVTGAVDLVTEDDEED